MKNNPVHIRSFKELSPKEVYQMCRLRSEVFVLEQKICCEEELDGLDYDCMHAYIKNDADEMIAYARFLSRDLTDRKSVV